MIYDYFLNDLSIDYQILRMLAPFQSLLGNLKIILGSQSPRRKELLSNILSNFEIIPSSFDESTIKPEDFPNPIDFVKEQSKRKCQELANHIKDADIVITADTIVTFDGHIIGKPHTHEKAFEMIKSLSGREHIVVTGVFVSFPKIEKTISFEEETKVFFYNVPEEVIKAYADSNDPLDKAGAYGIQSGAMSLISKIEGDYFNVVGLPVHKLSLEIYNILKKYY